MTTPLVPADVDLRDFPYMPLDVVRLRDSRLVSHATGEGFRCAVLLWCVSWHQVPAGSLPDDDIQLAAYAGFGRALKEWKKHRESALHGWVKCDDGRLYHPVVAEKAREAWHSRMEQRWRTECARIKKVAQRGGPAAVYPSFDEWLAHYQSTGHERWSPPVVPAPVPGDKGKVSPPRPSGNTIQGKGREGKGDPHKSEGEERAHVGTPEDSQLPAGVKPERWASYRDQLADDGKLSISRIKTALMQLHSVIGAGHNPNDVLTAAVMRGLRDLDDVAARLARERATSPPARGGQRSPDTQQQSLGKTAQTLHTLEAMKHGNELDQDRNSHGLPEAPHPRLGSDSRR